MRSIIIILFFTCLGTVFAQSGKKNILVVTGGHDFEEGPFFEMFESLKEVTYTHVTQPMANTLYSSSEMDKYDAIVFYDMWQAIEEDQKEAFVRLLKDGKGIVFLHHSMVSYQEWPEFIKILGGKYHALPYEKEGKMVSESTYKHDVEMKVSIEDKKHFITKGMKDFTLFDETYGNFEVLESSHPLLKTDHAESSPVIGWTNTYGKARVVYLQPGHGPQSFRDVNYRLLLFKSIHWVSAR